MTAVNILRRPAPAGGWAAARSDAKIHEQRRTNALLAHRESVEAGVVIPTVVIPNRRVQIRFRGACLFCGGSMFDLRLPSVDLEHPHVSYRGSVDCLLCARTVAHLVIGGGR